MRLLLDIVIGFIAGFAGLMAAVKWVDYQYDKRHPPSSGDGE